MSNEIMNRSALANDMKNYREKAGLTQKQLAEKSGINRIAISRMENEEREPLFFEVCRLAFEMDKPITRYVKTGG